MSLKVNVILVFLLVGLGQTLDNGLGLTPQMGWNSWNHYGCGINQVLIRKTADQLVSLGLAAKGYVYLNLDDCWQISRNETTKEIIQDKTKFPSGIKNLSDYAHSKGLKFGLYSDAGNYTCQKRPGSLGYETIDAKTYAKWEVDYLKYDNCFNQNISGKLRYLTMSKALNESGRHIFYSMCNWGKQKSWQWAAPLANSWRTTGDISDSWLSMLGLLDLQVGLQNYAGKGGWNDPDMLEVGNGRMTHSEYYAHFALWCILKAPLLIGCALDNISQNTLAILGNQQLIAINQDPYGKQGHRIQRNVGKSGLIQVWGGELANNSYVLGFFNRGTQTEAIQVSLSSDIKRKYASYTIRDAINHQDLGEKTEDIVKVNVDTHSIVVYVLKFKEEAKQLTSVIEE